MKKLFWFVLLIAIFLIFYDNKQLVLYGVPIPLFGNCIKIVFLFIIPLFLYWTFQEIKSEKFSSEWDHLMFQTVKNYMEKHNADKVENLQESYDIKDSQDIYYLNDKIILKTLNATTNDKKYFPGYILKIKKHKLCLIWLWFYLKTIFDLKIFPNIFLFFAGIIVCSMLILKILFNI